MKICIDYRILSLSISLGKSDEKMFISDQFAPNDFEEGKGETREVPKRVARPYSIPDSSHPLTHLDMLINALFLPKIV